MFGFRVIGKSKKYIAQHTSDVKGVVNAAFM